MVKREDETVQVLIRALGAARALHWRPKRRGTKQRGARGDILLHNGTVVLMEGAMQTHYQHYTPPDATVPHPHVRFTWKWIQRHNAQCLEHRQAPAAQDSHPEA